MKIVIIGTGYVGLVTGACFADIGHTVTCLDIDREKISSLQKGTVPFYEPQLEELLNRGAKEKRLHFTTNYESALQDAEVCFLALPTPAKQSGECDLSYLFAAVEQIAELVTKPLTIAVKSTVPVGTSSEIGVLVRDVLRERGLSIDIDIVSNPEFLKEGSAVNDCMRPDRIICGVMNKRAEQTMRTLYQGFTLKNDRLLIMDVRSAEMTKYAANAMLASRISFINEIAGLCECVGADINKVRLGIGSDHRIGLDFLYAGIGFGGSCFPKDLLALENMGEKAHYEMPLLKAVQTINSRQKKLLGKKIKSYFGNLKQKAIAIWGLSFKPNTDDLRQAPSLSLIEDLLEEGAELNLYDPVSLEKAKELLPPLDRIRFCNDPYEAARNVDGIALVTEWKQFRRLDFSQIRKEMRGKGFFDGRNQYDREEMQQLGFDYFGIGTQKVVKEEHLICQ